MPNPYVNKVMQSGSYGSGETSIETQSAYYITGTYGVVKAKPNTSDTTFKVEKYPVNAGGTYRISGSVYGDTSVYSFYDAEGNPVKWYNDKGGSSYHAVVGVVDTAPSNAVYLYVAHVTGKGDALVEKRMDTTLIDISDTTAVAADVASGKYFYLATGEKVAGSGSGGGGSATLITKSITANGTYSAEDDNADGYSSVTVNVPSSAASSWTKVAETSYQVSTTSTSSQTVATWATGHSEIWTSDKIVYVRIRDTAGKRAGYFYGSDTFFINHGMANMTYASSYANGARQMFYVNTDGDYGTYAGGGTTGYGVYPDTFYSDGRIRIRRRYNVNYSLTIDGTYKVEVYLLDPAGGIPIFE